VYNFLSFALKRLSHGQGIMELKSVVKLSAFVF
jgi:hypothetical protein